MSNTAERRLRILDDPGLAASDAAFEAWMVETFGEERDFFPVDLDAVLRGNLDPPEPTILRRSDGHHLLYDNMTHWIASEPEHGKSWFALLAVRELLEAGRKVVYFDYEMSPQDVVRRLLQLGLNRRYFGGLTYIRPPTKMTDEILEFYGTSTEDAPALFENVALVVFDACTEAMAAEGLDPLSNEGVATWMQRAPRLARRLGAATLIIDHVPKDRENRGRYAIGAQHKLAFTDVMYSLYSTQPFRPGAVGMSALAVGKDRPGAIRRDALEGRRAGTFVINAEDPDHLDAFIAASQEDEGPTDRMLAILDFARQSGVPLSKAQLESVGGGRTTTNRGAVTRLIAGGQLVPCPEDVASNRTYPRYVAAQEEE